MATKYETEPGRQIRTCVVLLQASSALERRNKVLEVRGEKKDEIHEGAFRPEGVVMNKSKESAKGIDMPVWGEQPGTNGCGCGGMKAGSTASRMKRLRRRIQ